ncbi:MAG: hypothetical protein OSA99_02140 [Acidimicrobiales bacterium]|nr:hypothetical protein [Acidimicrobiales bacterium]
MTVGRVDENRHEPGKQIRWCESWSFDFSSDDGSIGGWARLSLFPNIGRAGIAWYQAFVTGPQQQLVAVIDHAVPLPPSDLEIRTTGLWATHICETPHDHWTIGLEAFGLGVDDPGEIYGRQFGDRVPLGFDLEWEAVAPSEPVGRDRYRQPCGVTGELLVGSEEIDLDATGWRAHRWGLFGAWDDRSIDVCGRLDDGTTFASTVVNGDLATAVGTLAGNTATVGESSLATGDHGLPVAGRVRLDGVEIGLDVVGATPLELVDPEQRVARTPHAMCRCTTADGRAGSAWIEVAEPRS